MKISRSLAHDCCLFLKHLAAALSGELSCPQISYIYLQLTSAIFTFNVHCFGTQIHIFTMSQIDLPHSVFYLFNFYFVLFIFSAVFADAYDDFDNQRPNFSHEP